jgi:hypothetical protein
MYIVFTTKWCREYYLVIISPVKIIADVSVNSTYFIPFTRIKDKDEKTTKPSTEDGVWLDGDGKRRM